MYWTMMRDWVRDAPSMASARAGMTSVIAPPESGMEMILPVGASLLVRIKSRLLRIARGV